MTRLASLGPDLQELLTGLLGRTVTVRPQTSPLPLGTAAAVAEYLDDDSRISASCALDLGLGAAIAAALTMVPTQRLDDVRAAGVLNDDLAENLREVLNVAASLFNGAASEHLALAAVHRPPAEPTPEIVDFVVRAGDRVDLAVEVEEYGGGTWVGFRA